MSNFLKIPSRFHMTWIFLYYIISFISFADAFLAPRTAFPLGLAPATRTTSLLGLSSSNGISSAIKGCKIERVPNSLTTFTISIDGEEADLGKFSEIIYKKLIKDAKSMRFQGFRPGTIPPHLEPTYRAFAMDECAREATLEAMEQNKITPFDGARADFMIENISFLPLPKSTKKKSTKKRKEEEAQSEEVAPALVKFEDMKGAIDAGWKPGQNFSFTARNVKGNKAILTSDATLPVGSDAGIELDQAAANIIKNSSNRFMESE
mmetsp:Transcript_3654/g.5451  ORF Transcript_3654/g.5451 Transcript_3654/m.5451 type:complete len:264 (-) Transcript_3654:35-826(-)